MRQLSSILPLFILVSAFSPIKTKAQIAVYNSNAQNRHAEICATVRDSLTREAIPYASVYLIPAKDTAISNFTLTDPEGLAILKEIPFGEYRLCIELLGYRKIVLPRYIDKEKTNLGEILLPIDEQFIEAARITEYNNPIKIKKDTLEFNAKTFRVGSNEVLRDLIRRMPGFLINDEGRIIVGGTPINRITVGGRTFFFDDQTVALDNLPASAIERIRLINQDSNAQKGTEVEDFKQERVMDVELKKEYRRGLFGSLEGKFGTEALTRKDRFRSHRNLIGGTNAFTSIYGEKDQWTAVGNLGNTSNASGIYQYDPDIDPEVSPISGIRTGEVQVGLNYNSDRINDVETTVMVIMGENGLLSTDQTFRTDIGNDGNQLTGETQECASFFRKRKGENMVPSPTCYFLATGHDYQREEF